MEDKVIFKASILDEEGNIHFHINKKYRLLLEDKTGFYISKEKRGNVCSHFPKESLGVSFDLVIS